MSSVLTVDNILKISSPNEFNTAAMEVFRFQAEHCTPYREYLDAIGVTPDSVRDHDEIPFLPIEFFKTHRIYSAPTEPEAVFTSSNTGGGGAANHYVASLANYEQTYMRAFELFYGAVAEWSIYALLPSYLQREGSSLVRMADGLIRKGRGGGFYLYNHDKLMSDIEADRGSKIVLGVSYALLDLAERGEHLPKGTIVMETGGMKGRREEMPKEKMHTVLRQAFGVADIHSEYGMAEVMSQAYSKGRGIFRTPPWMRISVRDLSDPFDISSAGRGGVNITDLANLNSCSFIQTQDIGTVGAEGSFTIEGRAAGSDIRGCNLLVQ